MVISESIYVMLLTQPFFQQFTNKPIMIAAMAAIGAAIVIAFGPASLAVLAIIGLITAIGLIKSKWEEIRDGMNAILRPILLAIENFVNSAAAAIDLLLAAIDEIPGVSVGRTGRIDITPFNDPFGPAIGPLPPGFRRPLSFIAPGGVGPTLGPLPPGFVRPGTARTDAEIIADAVRRGIREGRIPTNIFVQNVNVEGDPLETLLGLGLPAAP